MAISAFLFSAMLEATRTVGRPPVAPPSRQDPDVYTEDPVVEYTEEPIPKKFGEACREGENDCEGSLECQEFRQESLLLPTYVFWGCNDERIFDRNKDDFCMKDSECLDSERQGKAKCESWGDEPKCKFQCSEECLYGQSCQESHDMADGGKHYACFDLPQCENTPDISTKCKDKWGEECFRVQTKTHYDGTLYCAPDNCRDYGRYDQHTCEMLSTECHWKSGQCVAKHMLGHRNTNFCPPGSIYITDEESCAAAAKAKGYIWMGLTEGTEEARPTKCYVSLPGRQVYFNVGPLNIPRPNVLPICAWADASSLRIDMPNPIDDDEIEDCAMSEDGKKCNCPHPVDPEDPEDGEWGMGNEGEVVSTECLSHEHCDFDTGKCLPDCAKKLPDWQCKCGEDSNGNVVVCKNPNLCDNDTGRSDIPIVSCDDDTDGSTGRVWEDI